jgi:hypothetical protein
MYIYIYICAGGRHPRFHTRRPVQDELKKQIILHQTPPPPQIITRQTLSQIETLIKICQRIASKALANQPQTFCKHEKHVHGIQTQVQKRFLINNTSCQTYQVHVANHTQHLTMYLYIARPPPQHRIYTFRCLYIYIYIYT